MAALTAFGARASEFDYTRIADAVERCEDRLIVAAPKAPVVDDSLRAYVARLSVLKRETEVHLAASLIDPVSPFFLLHKRKYQESTDLRDLLGAGLFTAIRDGHLDVMEMEDGLLLHSEFLSEPIWRIAYAPEGPGTGVISLIGWSRTRRLRYADHRIHRLDDEAATARPPGREGDADAEAALLAAHGAAEAPTSLLLEATGWLAERLVTGVRAVCRGEVVSGELKSHAYPNSFLALAARTLRHDPVFRELIAGAINEHVHGEMEVRARRDESHVFTFKPRGCKPEHLDFVVPADPFRDPAGWGRLL